MRSLRARLLAGTIGGMILLLVIFSLLLYVVIADALTSQFDASLASMTQILAAAIEYEDGEIELEFDVQQMPELQNARQPTHYQLWGPDGTVVAKSPRLGTHDLVRVEGAVPGPVFRSSRDESGRPQRTACLKFVPSGMDNDRPDAPQPANERAFTLAVARDAGGLQGQLRSLRGLLGLASAGVVTLSFLIGELVVRRGLRPLHAIAAEIAAVRADNLTAQIGAERVPAEAVPIRNRLNELLSRLEASFNRERQFNADVAHELRTPLAGLRSTIEVTLARHRDAAEYRAALVDCLAITQGMQSVIDNLLMLARLEARHIVCKREPVRLGDLVDACWRSVADRARERQIVFENRIPAELTCRSDPEHLSMIFSNLLDNAAEYADEGGRIWTTAVRTGHSTEMAVSNTGCRLTAEQVSRVFDCFWRSDPSRLSTGTHCGLGLALVQRLVRALGGNAAADLQAGVFTMQLTLPEGV